MDYWVRGQPGLQSEFQDSQGYTEKPLSKNINNQNQTNQTKDKPKPTKPNQKNNQWTNRKKKNQNIESSLI